MMCLVTAITRIELDRGKMAVFVFDRKCLKTVRIEVFWGTGQRHKSFNING